jgi:GR25 family glycosyltransferase involved in LPS biosynthesis
MKHFVVWSDMVVNNITSALILEDDILLTENFVEKFNNQIKDLSTDYDFVWIGSCCDMNLPFNDKHLIRRGMSRCAHGYLLNNKTARLLIENYKYNNFPVDIYFNNIMQTLNLESYWMEPDLIRQSNSFETSIQNKF